MSKQWYVVHTYSGYENKVKTSLEERRYSQRQNPDPLCGKCNDPKVPEIISALKNLSVLSLQYEAGVRVRTFGPAKLRAFQGR